MTLRTKASSSIRWSAFNSGSTVILSFAQLAILGRLLGPDAFGLMAMLMVVIEVARIFSQMGLSEAVISKQDTDSQQLSSLYWINVITGIVLYGGLVVVAPLVAALFKEPELKDMLPVAATIFILSSVSLQFETLLRKALLFKLFASINILAVAIGVIISVSLALWGYGVWSLIYGQVAGQGTRTVALFTVAIRKKWLPQRYFDFQGIKEHFSFGLYRVAAMIANQVNSRVDQLAIGVLLGPIALGYYNVAFRIVLQPIQRINPILTQVAFPVFSIVQNDNAQLKRGFLKMIHLLMSVNAPALIGICAVAPLAVPLLMGEKWGASVPLVQVLAFYALLRSLGNAGGSLIMAKGKANWTLYWNLALLMLIPASVISAILLKESVLLVCFLLVCLQIVLVFVHYYVFLRRLIGPFLRAYLTAIGKPIVSAACMGIGVFYLQSALSHLNAFLNLGLSIALGGLIYGIASLLVQKELFAEYWNILPEKIQNKLRWIWSVSHA